MCSFPFSPNAFDNHEIDAILEGLINLLERVPDIKVTPTMFNWIHSFLELYKSMSKWRMDDSWDIYKNPRYLILNGKLLTKIDENSKLQTKSPEVKQANAILAELLLIIFLKSSGKTEEAARSVFSVILDMCLEDAAESENFITSCTTKPALRNQATF